ncbi:MAG: hypothetical protein ANABAC_3547 [Anaerolineae bacterium]|nr:MAG: hypothetical protein ANABAC_3547 [Anaerolineae bacterium]
MALETTLILTGFGSLSQSSLHTTASLPEQPSKYPQAPELKT